MHFRGLLAELDQLISLFERQGVERDAINGLVKMWACRA
jgi:hypothetical protein